MSIFLTFCWNIKGLFVVLKYKTGNYGKER